MTAAIIERLDGIYEDLLVNDDPDQILCDLAELLDEIDPHPFVSRATIVEAKQVAR